MLQTCEPCSADRHGQNSGEYLLKDAKRDVNDQDSDDGSNALRQEGE